MRESSTRNTDHMRTIMRTIMRTFQSHTDHMRTIMRTTRVPFNLTQMRWPVTLKLLTSLPLVGSFCFLWYVSIDHVGEIKFSNSSSGLRAVPCSTGMLPKRTWSS